jgi:dolichol-phosphate mannosyltransferase
MNQSLTVVIPVYNEEESIETVLTAWHYSLKRLNIPHDFVVVNDGSTDHTEDILNHLSNQWDFLHIYTQTNAGHGAAIRYGYTVACTMNNDYIFQTDSDHQFTPADFESFWANRNDYQAIFGIREDRKDPPLRKIISGFLQKVIFDIYNIDIPDANIPYRMYHKNYLKNLLAVTPTNTFAPNIFLSLLCFKSKEINTKTIPVTHFERAQGVQKLVHFGLLKGCFKSFIEIFKFSYSIDQKLEFIHEKLIQDQLLSEKNHKNIERKDHLKVA